MPPVKNTLALPEPLPNTVDSVTSVLGATLPANQVILSLLYIVVLSAPTAIQVLFTRFTSLRSLAVTGASVAVASAILNPTGGTPIKILGVF